jgi:hypothetical protein
VRTTLPVSPWSIPPANAGAKAWRQNCFPAVAHIKSAINNSYPGIGKEPSISPHDATLQLLEHIFQKNEMIPDSDRASLIQWLGKAGAISAESGARNWRTIGTMGYVESGLMETWMSCAWLGVPKTKMPDWAEKFIQSQRKVVSDPSSPHQIWGDISDGWIPNTERQQTNAQMDLMTYLYAFDQHMIEQGVNPGAAVIDDTQSRITSDCFLSFRILAAATEKMAPQVLDQLRVIENLYSYAYVDTNILQIATAAYDYKILNGQPLSDDIAGAKNTPLRTRKL